MSNLRAWIHSTRPKTLPASLAPVFIGSSYSYYLGKFDWLIFGLICLISLLVQISTNFINDIYDFKNGVDNINRIGPKKSLFTGAISLSQMKTASILIMFLTFMIGLWVCSMTSWWLMPAGILSMLFAWAYTGGPYPLSSKGLAEPFVFIFFGLVATNGTIFAFTNEISQIGVYASFMPGLLSTTLLMVNNIRDIENDSQVGKMTLEVRLGKEKSVKLFNFLVTAALLVPIFMVLTYQNFLFFIPLIAVPLYGRLSKYIDKYQGKELNKLLALNGILLILNGLLTSLTFIFMKIL
ncbi:MAG: 1,4-dihydroxy-2-naphthoate octaprenyltransferase [Ignavibacteria bacterium GWF2_33_9]|nr:MAG: 1,4-dihydroxy-2-naphthoate octaprenyltransferase [Ignavibacteria bacterium GWF2_33_9]